MKITHAMVLVLSLLILMPTMVQAEESPDRFSGRVGLGVMFIDSGNNLNPSGSDSYLKDLRSSASRRLSTIPGFLPSITYDAGEPGNLKLYFDTKPAIEEVGGFSFNIGGSHPVASYGILDMGIFYSPFGEVWKNPYQTLAPRDETDITKYGFKIAFNRILGTGLRTNFTYMVDDVDEDLIGTLMPDLKRDGSIYSLNVNYSFFSSKTFELRPRISFRRGSYDGDSNSFDKIKLSLDSRYTLGRTTFLPGISYSHSSYDETDPIFHTTRKTDSYQFKMLVSYATPFDLEDWAAQGLISLSRGDSNIEFYDTESISGGLFMTYLF